MTRALPSLVVPGRGADTLDLPRNERVEQALLAELLTDNTRVALVSDALAPEHFYDPLHGRIYRAITAMVERGEDASPTTLHGVLRRAPEAKDAPGGIDAYIVQLYEAVIGGDVRHYARTILDLHRRRQLIRIALQLVEDAQDLGGDRGAADLIDEAGAALLDLDDGGDRAQPLTSVRGAVEEAIAAADAAMRSGSALTGVTTGFVDLDWRLGGLQPGELIVLGARPSMGKSDLAWNIAVNAARAFVVGRHGGAEAAVFSQEMVARQLGMRFLARECGVPADRQRRGEVEASDFAAFAAATPDLPLWIDGTSRVTPAHVLRRARRLQQRHGLGLVVIDHLNIMGAPAGFQGQGETAVITETTRELKAVATTLGVPVLLLTQLNRAVELREDKRPTLADLRQSGSIEQDADTVMFLFREEYYLLRSEPSRRPDEGDDKFNDRYRRWEESLTRARGLADIIVAKQRMGPTGTVTLHYDGARSAFSNISRLD